MGWQSLRKKWQVPSDEAEGENRSLASLGMTNLAGADDKLGSTGRKFGWLV